MSVFMYLADKICGTNVSGLNNQGSVQISEHDFNRANEALEQNSVLHNQNAALQQELQRIKSKYEAQIGQANSELKRQQKLESELANSIFEEVGHHDLRISEKARADYFVRTQFFSLAARFGLDNKQSPDVIRSQMSLKQKFTFNVYMIASADYMLMQNYLGSIVTAIDEIIDGAKADPNSDFASDPQNIANISSVRAALISDLISFSRIDSSAYKNFHKKRVQEIGAMAKLVPGTSDIDVNSVPPITYGQIDEILREAKAISAVKARITDSGAREALLVGGGETLIPSAYTTNQFHLRSWMA